MSMPEGKDTTTAPGEAETTTVLATTATAPADGRGRGEGEGGERGDGVMQDSRDQLEAALEGQEEEVPVRGGIGSINSSRYVRELTSRALCLEQEDASSDIASHFHRTVPLRAYRLERWPCVVYWPGFNCFGKIASSRGNWMMCHRVSCSNLVFITSPRGTALEN